MLNVPASSRKVVAHPRPASRRSGLAGPGSSRASPHTDTQAEAIDRARKIVHNAGGGEVRIHGRDGKIRDSDTIAPRNDPKPPRDKR